METTRRHAPDRLRALPSWLLDQAALAANRLVAEGLDSVATRRHHYALLTALAEGGPASQAALSRVTAIDRSDMVAAVNELADRGLVERSADPTDRRRNIVAITPDGRRQLRRLDRMIDRIQDELLTPLSASERRLLIELLTRVVDHDAGR